jgi:hypothetical protein
MSNEVSASLVKRYDEISMELAKIITNEIRISEIETEIDNFIYRALNLSKREQFLIEDVLNNSLELFQEGENSLAYHSVSSKGLKDYLEILNEDINEHFQFSETTVWASIWEMPSNITMRLVAIHFTNDNKPGSINSISLNNECTKLINKIDQYSYEKHSASVYFRKVVKYFTNDTLYIMKPNQRRFWSRSQAMQDSNSIILEIANMGVE